MSDSAILKEYLVKLGFKLDDKSLKGFTGAVDSAEKAVLSFVTRLEGAVMTIAASVAAYASNLSTLYFASIRINDSAGHIKAFEYAARQLGVSSDSARQSLQSFADWMRSTPASLPFLESLGIKTRDANGNVRQTTELLTQLGSKLQAMPYYMAKQYAGQLGMSEDVMRLLMSPQFSKLLEQGQGLYKGFDQLATNAVKFNDARQRLQATAEKFLGQLQGGLIEKFGPQIKEFTNWLDTHGEQLANRLEDVVGILLKFAQAVGVAFGKIVEVLVYLDSKTDGFTTKALALLAVFRALGGFAVISGITALAKAVAGLGASTATAEAAASGGILARLAGLGGLLAGGVGAYLGFHSEGLNTNEDAELRKARARGATIDNPGGVPLGLRNNNPGNLNYAGQAGATPAGRFARFQSAEAGLQAMARQLRLYASRGMNTVQSIIGRYAPSSENNTSAYISAVSKRLGVSANQQLDLSNPDVMANLMGAMIKQEQGVNPFSAQTLRSAASGVSIHQQNNITISGATDPAMTARMVAQGIEGSNESLSRNLKTAVQ